jgi:glycosyltransferase involved in cell wall biosynthesis
MLIEKLSLKFFISLKSKIVVNKVAFSVIMPAYNAAGTILDAVNSVLKQTFHDYEIIIVEDASKDNTREVIEELVCKNNNCIKAIFLDENKGVAEARNEAIRIARGKYLTFLDSDDLWLENKLEEQLRILGNGADIVFSSYYRLLPNGRRKKVTVPKMVTYKQMLGCNFIGNLTGAYNCHNLGKIYQKSIGHEDYLMWLELLKIASKATGIQEPLAIYRVGALSLSSNKLKAVNNFIWGFSMHQGIFLNIYSYLFSKE